MDEETSKHETPPGAPKQQLPDGEDRAFCLPLSNIWLTENDTLVRLGSDGKPISSFPLTEITSLRCRRTISWAAVTVAAVSVYSGKFAVEHIDNIWLGGFVALFFGLVVFVALVGGAIEVLLIVTTKDGKVKFSVADPISDTQAFVLTVKRIKQRGRSTS